MLNIIQQTEKYIPWMIGCSALMVIVLAISELAR